MKIPNLPCCLACFALLLAIVFLPGGRASAQLAGGDGFAHAMHQSMAGMHHAMEAVPVTGDADKDFAAMMIPHHQGALEMAKAELLYGKDPVLRRLAQEILIDQQSEIQVMKLWLNKKQGAVGPSKRTSK